MHWHGFTSRLNQMNSMKKWITALLLFAFIISETSCVVRVHERRRPAPPPRRVVVY